jgi:hypothetical protein
MIKATLPHTKAATGSAGAAASDSPAKSGEASPRLRSVSLTAQLGHRHQAALSEYWCCDVPHGELATALAFVRQSTLNHRDNWCHTSVADQSRARCRTQAFPHVIRGSAR